MVPPPPTDLGMDEDDDDPVPLPNVNGAIMKKVCPHHERCPIAWHQYLLKSKFSDFGRKPWTIIRRFDRN